MFEARGDRPQWQTVYDTLSAMGIGDVIKDAELAGLLPDAPEGSVRSAFYRAVKQLEEDRQRTFTRVRCVGYRMVHAREHEALARGQHRKARRRLAAAHRKAHAADRALLTREERQRLDAIEINLAQQSDMIRRLDRGLKVERQERKAETAGLAEKVDQLAALLARHGITDAQKHTDAEVTT